MFVKQYGFNSKIKPIYVLFKRNYDIKKMTLKARNNPHVKNILENEIKRRESKGVLDKLVDKRTAEYKEYFSQSPEPSIIKRTSHSSYDHIGQKRAIHLSKVLRSFIADRIGSGEIGDVLSGKHFQITNIVVPVDLNRIEILWWSPEHEANLIEELLKKADKDLRTAIRHAQLLPNIPPVVFKRDNLRSEIDEIHHLLDTIDKGETDQMAETNSIEPLKERQDLYDSDRTAILRKLSTETINNEEEVVAEVNVEQLERRMKAFALTKRMKRVQEQRSAIYGIMAIEKERQDQEHFSLNESSEIGHEKNS